MNMLDHSSKHSTGCQSKDNFQDSHLCFFEGPLPQQLSPCLSAYTPSRTLGTTPVQMNFFYFVVQDGNLKDKSKVLGDF